MQRVDYLVAYDVNTEDKEGRRRLRQAAKACKAYGQRVQQSLFECSVNEVQYEAFKRKLVAIIDPKVDNLRIYRLTANRANYLESFGKDYYIDFEEPLIV